MNEDNFSFSLQLAEHDVLEVEMAHTDNENTDPSLTEYTLVVRATRPVMARVLWPHKSVVDEIINCALEVGFLKKEALKFAEKASYAMNVVCDVLKEASYTEDEAEYIIDAIIRQFTYLE